MMMTKEPVPKLNYDHSEVLDVHQWSNYSQVNGFVDSIYELLFRKRPASPLLFSFA